MIVLVDVREDLGHLREGAHGVGVDVALFKDVDVEGGGRIFVRPSPIERKSSSPCGQRVSLIVIPAFAAAFFAASTRLGPSLIFWASPTPPAH